MDKEENRSYTIQILERLAVIEANQTSMRHDVSSFIQTTKQQEQLILKNTLSIQEISTKIKTLIGVVLFIGPLIGGVGVFLFRRVLGL